MDLPLMDPPCPNCAPAEEARQKAEREAAVLREGTSANGLQTAAQQSDLLSYHTNHYKEDRSSSGAAPKAAHPMVKCSSCGLFKRRGFEEPCHHCARHPNRRQAEKARAKNPGRGSVLGLQTAAQQQDRWSYHTAHYKEIPQAQMAKHYKERCKGCGLCECPPPRRNILV